MSSGFDPGGSNALVAAVDWMSELLGGTLALVIAVLAVASVGLLLISGRVDVRRAVQVIFGCFIIFGASTIATGLVRAMAAPGNPDTQTAVAPPSVYPAASARSSSPISPYDPYAGAALPPRR